MNKKNLVIIRGGGASATGIVQKLVRSGFNVIILETKKPTCLKRKASLAQAIYQDGIIQVEDIKALHVKTYKEIIKSIKEGIVPIVVDPKGLLINKLEPLALVDAINDSTNYGTNKSMALHTIGVGPSFKAGIDVDIVVESNNGLQLGRIYAEGYALKEVDNPYKIKAIHQGHIQPLASIGDYVKQNQPIIKIDDTIIKAEFDGLITGMIHEQFHVYKGQDIIEIDPRLNISHLDISAKDRNIGGATLEALLYLMNKEYATISNKHN